MSIVRGIAAFYRVKREDGFFEHLHPRYPKGDPKAGQFIPKAELIQSAKTKAKLLFEKHKGTIAKQGIPIGAGLAVGAKTGTLGGVIATATARSIVSVGAKIHENRVKLKEATMKRAEVEIAEGSKLQGVVKSLSAKTIDDLKQPEFQYKLEKDYLTDLAAGAIKTGVEAVSSIPALGLVVSKVTSKAAGEALSKIIRKSKEPKERKLKDAKPKD